MGYVQASVGYIWAPAKSQIYAVLPRLVSDGFARRRDVIQLERPDKQLYRITKAGERAFRHWLEGQSWRSHDELLLKVFFGRFLSSEALSALIERFRGEERERLEEYRAIERRMGGRDDEVFGYATLRFGLRAVRARIRWADELLRELPTFEEER